MKELTTRLPNDFEITVFSGEDADSFSKIINGHFDIVIPINGRIQALKASLGRFVGGYKLLISGHSGIGRDDLWNIMVRPDIFVALTGKAEEWAKNWAWGSRVVKIHNGIDLKRFTKNGQSLPINLPRPVILSVGALVWNKNHQNTIKAVAKMNKGSLLIVGEGPQKDEFEQLGNKLLPGRFEITSLPYSDIPKVYRSADLFTLPSWDREAFGIVYLEAMASGLGVVAPDDQNRREIIGQAGILVNVDDSNIFAQALEKAVANDWSEIVRSQAEKFSWDKIAEQYAQIFRSLSK